MAAMPDRDTVRNERVDPFDIRVDRFIRVNQAIVRLGGRLHGPEIAKSSHRIAEQLRVAAGGLLDGIAPGILEASQLRELLREGLTPILTPVAGPGVQLGFDQRLH